jgi:ATP-dependent DNA ligase
MCYKDVIMMSINSIMSKKYPVLFKNKMEWSVFIHPFNNTDSYEIVVKYGHTNGKIQIKTRIINAGKASRSIFQQADLEANRMWVNKKDKDGYTEVRDEAGGQVIRPMLAQTYLPKSTRKQNIRFPCAAQPKWDGIRCMAHLDETGEVVLQSRRGIPFQNMGAIRSELRTLFSGSLPNDMYLDGELYSHDIPFEEISGIVRTKDAGNDKQSDKLFLVIYDCFNAATNVHSYKDRVRIISDHVKPTKHIQICKTITICKSEEVDSMHDQFVEDGFEGIILRNFDSLYELDKRSYSLQKYKKFQDEEFTITGFKDGVGIDKGLIIWQCKCNDRVFDVRPNGTHASRKALFQEGGKYIGKQLTVKFQGLTQDGCPRFPIGKGIREEGV